jgi:uroporphyrinogen-III synthase
MPAPLPLQGARVLLPRGEELGDRLASAVRRYGGDPVIAPIIEFHEPADSTLLAASCRRLTAGAYDWVAVTSATTVGALVHHGVSIPESTRVAVVGPATRDAMQAAGYATDFMPIGGFSAQAMVTEWPASNGTVLLPQSAIAERTLADGLTARGLSVTTVVAYETRELDWTDDIRHQLAEGKFTAVLLTSASVARAVASQAGLLAASTVVACIGESTAAGAREAGLPVHAIAEQSTAEGLVDALCLQLEHHGAVSVPENGK